MKKTKNITPDINITAAAYQQLAREMKALEAKMKPLKDEIVDYARLNPDAFDEAFQIKFPNGTYISLRVTDVLKADDDAKETLMNNLSDDYVEYSLHEKLIIREAQTNKAFQKQLKLAGARIEQKEIYAVYAG